MILYITKYLTFILLLVSCRNQETEVRNYGIDKNGNKGLNVSLQLSEFNKYGFLIDRIEEIRCNDSIPTIVIKNQNFTRTIYPIGNCQPISFAPEIEHYVTFRNSKPYLGGTTTELSSDSISEILNEEFIFHRNSKSSNVPESYLVIIESGRSEPMYGIEKFLTQLTQAYDNLQTELELNIAFWEIVPPLPPPPANNQVYTQ